MIKKRKYREIKNSKKQLFKVNKKNNQIQLLKRRKTQKGEKQKQDRLPY